MKSILKTDFLKKKKQKSVFFVYAFCVITILIIACYNFYNNEITGKRYSNVSKDFFRALLISDIRRRSTYILKSFTWTVSNFSWKEQFIFIKNSIMTDHIKEEDLWREIDIVYNVEKAQEYWENYVYIKSLAKYYWIEKRKFFNPADVASNLMVTSKQLLFLRMEWIVKTYDDIVYCQWGKEWCLNLLDESLILKPSDNPILHPDIQDLIENVCGYKPENIDYLNKLILYKYTHINDHTIPSMVLYWAWWSGKGTLMTLLASIFWSVNVLANLGQRDLTWWFDTYRWRKLVVEFAEITTNHTNNDIRILNKLKNIIGAENITINEKNVQQYQVENIALFFITSNANKPIHLDEKEKGNRRFSVIKSMTSLRTGERINKTIKKESNIQDYLAWLLETYPEVENYKELKALDNKDKTDLEEMNQNEANQFWEWLLDNYPEFYGKKQLIEINSKMQDFCTENDYNYDDFKKFFWKNSKYQKKKIRFWEKSYYGVDIPEPENITIDDIKDIFC